MIGKNIYDISLDEMREVTQDDVDKMFRCLQTSGKMVRILRKLLPDLVPKAQSDGSFNEKLDQNLKHYMQENQID